MKLRRCLARLYWSVSRWRPSPDAPPEGGTGVLLGVPHTSNWDFVLMLALTWHFGISVRWLGKSSLFKPPFGRLMRALGGIPVQRDDPGALVAEVVARIRDGERFYLVVTPEGTRTPVAYWKSGFYRIARDTDLPVTLGYVDHRNGTTGFGPTLRLTGDVAADMGVVRAFYADKIGVRPRAHVPPRLRDESGRAPAPPGDTVPE